MPVIYMKKWDYLIIINEDTIINWCIVILVYLKKMIHNIIANNIFTVKNEEETTTSMSYYALNYMSTMT